MSIFFSSAAIYHRARLACEFLGLGGVNPQGRIRRAQRAGGGGLLEVRAGQHWVKLAGVRLLPNPLCPATSHPKSAETHWEQVSFCALSS